MNGGNDVRESLHDCCNSFLCNTAAETPPPVTFESRSECHDNHGEHRWAVKNDASTPPTVAKTIQVVTPSDIRSWVGPDVPLTQSSERAGIEDKWFALTGRVVAVKAETDGYLHIELQDARLAISRVSLLLRCRMRVDSSSKASECRADRIELDEGNFSMFSR